MQRAAARGAAARSPRPCAGSTPRASASTDSRSAGPTLDDVFLALTGHAAEDSDEQDGESEEEAA